MKFRILIVGLLVFCFSAHTYAVSNIEVELAAKSTMETYFDLAQVSVQDFLDLKASEIKAKTGKKLTIKERILLPIIKAEVYFQSKKNSELDAEYYYHRGARNFNLGGFLLGLFLPIIGNLIAILFGRNAFRSSLKGTLVAIILWLLLGISFI